MLYDIEFLQSPNFESRRGFKPICIVNHITDGQEAVRTSDEHEEKAVEYTFMSPDSQASAHFDILRDGRIKQYVPITYAAWTQGLHSAAEVQQAPSPIVRQMGVNPNLYSISKEYEAYADHGGYGNITEAQFWSGLWLDKLIQTQVKEEYGHTLMLNSTFVIGHCDIDNVRRKFDPGPQFPWAHYFSEYGIIQDMSLEDVERRILYFTSDKYKLENCFKVMNEVDYLYTLTQSQDAGTVSWARNVFKSLYSIFAGQNVLPDKYSATEDAKQFRNDVMYVYDCALGKNGAQTVGWGIQMLNRVFPVMKARGLT